MNDTAKERVVRVQMLAFMEGELREVRIPQAEADEVKDVQGLLERVFHYGQNDFQPSPNRCSVSVGDVIDLRDDLKWPGIYRVDFLGFSKISPEEYQAYVSMPREQRMMHSMFQKKT